MNEEGRKNWVLLTKPARRGLGLMRESKKIPATGEGKNASRYRAAHTEQESRGSDEGEKKKAPQRPIRGDKKIVLDES